MINFDFQQQGDYFAKPEKLFQGYAKAQACLLYTSDAADERSSVDLGGRRIIKKKHEHTHRYAPTRLQHRKHNRPQKKHI